MSSVSHTFPSNIKFKKTDDAKQCPWCERWCLKDDACNYIFACGLVSGSGKFVIGAGCGKSWCFECGKKFCGTYIDPLNGRKTSEAKEHHNNVCCKSEVGFKEEEYCCGGHNSHCNKRW
jgi:hypothetical protein